MNENRKKYMKEYRNRPDVKKRLQENNKKYRSKPEVKKRYTEYQKDYMKKRRKNPEIYKRELEREKEHRRERREAFDLLRSLTKYTCFCGQIIYGTEDLKSKCNKCKTNFKVVNNG